MKKNFITAFIVLSFAFAFSTCNNGTTNKDTSTTTTDKKEKLAKDEVYTCSMHNQVMSEKPGHCSLCGMTLVKEMMTPEQQKMMKEGTYVKSKEEQ